MSNDNDYPHLYLDVGELLLVVNAVRWFGKHVKTHPDCTPIDHQVNKLLINVRNQLQKNYPGLWERLTQDSGNEWMFDPNIEYDTKPYKVPYRNPHPH